MHVMLKRSIIAFDNTDEISSIFCDYVYGSLYHIGLTLHQYYTDIEKVEDLMDLGDLSVLGTEIGEKHEFDYDVPIRPVWCQAYGRDGNHPGTGALTHGSIEGLLHYFNNSIESIDYLYVFDGHNWTYTTKRPGLTRKDLIPVASDELNRVLNSA